MLLSLVLTSCSIITGGAEGDNDELYKAAIERFYDALLKVDIDNFLDSLDPLGPLYPDAASIEELRAEAEKGAYAGEVVVKELTTLEESATRAKVKVTLFMSVDIDRSGKFYEETFSPTFDLTCKDGVWRVFGGLSEKG